MKKAKNSKEKVVKILMERDGITQRDAKLLITECLQEIMEGNFDAIGDVLGLEDDYIFYLI